MVQGGTGQHRTVRNGHSAVTKFTAEVAVLHSRTQPVMALHAGIPARSVLEPVGDLQVDDLDHFIRVEKGVDGHELDEMAGRDEHSDLGTGGAAIGTVDDSYDSAKRSMTAGMSWSRKSADEGAHRHRAHRRGVRRADRRRPARREPDDVRSPSCRLVPFGGQSLAGGDDTLAESLGQLVEIHDDVVSEDSGAFVR